MVAHNQNPSTEEVDEGLGVQRSSLVKWQIEVAWAIKGTKEKSPYTPNKSRRKHTQLSRREHMHFLKTMYDSAA